MNNEKLHTLHLEKNGRGNYTFRFTESKEKINPLQGKVFATAAVIVLFAALAYRSATSDSVESSGNAYDPNRPQTQQENTISLEATPVFEIPLETPHSLPITPPVRSEH